MNKIKMHFITWTMTFSCVQAAHALDMNDVIGGVLGGGAAGLICNEMGASPELTAACAIGGTLLGTHIAQQMSQEDYDAYYQTQNEAFDGIENRHYDWRNRRSRTGIHGRLTPNRWGYRYDNREVCREMKTVTYMNGRAYEEEHTVIVCRRSDGRYYKLEQRNVFRYGRLEESETRQVEGRRPRYDRDRRNPRYDDRDGRGRRYDDGERGYDDRDYSDDSDYSNGGYDNGRNGGRPGRNSGYGREGYPVPPAPTGNCQGWSPYGLQMGTNVYDGNGNPAIYRNFDPNNRNFFVTNFSGAPTTLPMKDVAVPGCHYGWAYRQTVSTSGGRGPIVGVYMNGDVVIEINRRFTKRIPSSDIYR